MNNIYYEETPLWEFVVVAGKSYEAAKILAEYLTDDGLHPDIMVEEESVQGRHEIRVGVSNSSSNRRLKFSGLERSGFTIKFALGNILIRADSVEGETNGVLEFLRKYAGWRFYPECDERVNFTKLVLHEGGGFSYTPAFAYRGFRREASVWEVMNHLNFVLRETVRVDFDGSAIAAAEEIEWALDYSPEENVIDVGCPAGSGDNYLEFMNDAGVFLADDYPEAVVELCVDPAEVSLPEKTSALGNIGVKLTSDGGALREYVSGWAGVTSHLCVEYVVDMDENRRAVVDFHSAADDFRFFADRGVEGVCVSFRGAGADPCAEYVLARLMWNPFLSTEEIDALVWEAGKLG